MANGQDGEVVGGEINGEVTGGNCEVAGVDASVARLLFGAMPKATSFEAMPEVRSLAVRSMAM